MTTLDEQLAMNVPLFEQRIQLDDRVEVPRPVEHFAIFRRHASAQEAAAGLEREGYVVDLDRRFMKTTLVATADSPVDLETSNEFTRAVSSIVTSAGGSYDGWGASVVK